MSTASASCQLVVSLAVLLPVAVQAQGSNLQRDGLDTISIGWTVPTSDKHSRKLTKLAIHPSGRVTVYEQVRQYIPAQDSPSGKEIRRSKPPTLRHMRVPPAVVDRIVQQVNDAGLTFQTRGGKSHALNTSDGVFRKGAFDGFDKDKAELTILHVYKKRPPKPKGLKYYLSFLTPQASRPNSLTIGLLNPGEEPAFAAIRPLLRSLGRVRDTVQKHGTLDRRPGLAQRLSQLQQGRAPTFPGAPLRDVDLRQRTGLIQRLRGPSTPAKAEQRAKTK